MTNPMVATLGPQYLRDVAMGLRRMGFPISSPSLEQMAAQWEADRDFLYSLLAVIHRDGGHYTGEHGVEKSARDAQQVVHADRAALERATLDHAVALSGQADNLLRAERAEAALVELGRRLAAKTMALQEAEESIDRLQSTKEDLTAEIKEFYAEREAFYESFRRSYDEETKKLHAALEQARALAPFVNLYIEYLESEQGYEHDGSMAWRSWQDQITDVQNVLAAALAEGGAA